MPALELSNASQVGRVGFVGQPPAEIAALVTQTATDAAAFSKTAHAINQCARTICATEMFDFGSARTQLESSLAAWGPYS